VAGEKERERIETFVRGRVKGVLSVTYACCKYLQCVVGCCSVLQCAAVCRSVLQCVAVCIFFSVTDSYRHMCVL